jgi:Fic family protein
MTHVVEAPTLQSLIARVSDSGRLLHVIGSNAVVDSGDYLHWDKLRHKTPPEGLTHEEWWLALKSGRRQLLRPIPLTDADGLHFQYGTPDVVLRLLHYVDQRCSGSIAMPEVVTADEQARQHYLVNSLMEEAIRSSQLEGATTTRRVAKDLLRSGRPPEDRSERMILNNYRALQFMRDGIGDTLTPEAVLELQRVLTDGTLDYPSGAGRLQTPEEERVAVLDRSDGHLLHRPPPASQLPGRLRALCDFANEGEDAEHFVHPVLRAILLHFWLAYDHPFEDGNGRTARALFYWYMRTHGYWLVEYLSISQILQQAPSQYARSFLLTETDERDATYFIVYQLRVAQRAIEELHDYLNRKVKEIQDVERLVAGGSSEFNHRQLALLGNAVRNPNHVYTFRSHATSHGVTHETARNDLLPLVRKKLLNRRKTGQRHEFTPAGNLYELLENGSPGSPG